MGLSEGVVPLIAYNFVSNKTRMKDTIKVVIVSIAVIFAVCMTVVLVAGHSIVQLFSTDPQIVVLATFILKVTMTSLLLNGIDFYLLACCKLQDRVVGLQLWQLHKEQLLFLFYLS